MPKIKDLMRPIDEVVHTDQDLKEAFARMRKFELPFLPVVDGDEIVGILTARDIYGQRSPGTDESVGTKVRDHLSDEIAFCYEEDDLLVAKTVIDESGHHRLLVTDENGYLSGLITLEAITAALRDRSTQISTESEADGEIRVVEGPVRAKGDPPGTLRSYAVKPKLRR